MQSVAALNEQTEHPKVSLTILTTQAPIFVAGTSIQGVLEVQNTSERVCLRDVVMTLSGAEALTCLDHTAAQIILQVVVICQSRHDPSNLVHDDLDQAEGGYWHAKVGRARFPFCFRLPPSLPSSYTFGKNAKLQYSLKAEAHILYRNRKTILTKTTNVIVLERCDDWQDDAYWETITRECISRIPLTFGSVSLRASISPALHWPDSQDLTFTLPIHLSVKNTTSKQLGPITVRIVRRLRIGARRARDPIYNLPTTQNDELLATHTLSSTLFDVGPGRECVQLAHVPVPESALSVRGYRLADVDMIVQVSMTLDHHEALLELPIIVTHALSMPPPAWEHRRCFGINVFDTFQAGPVRPPVLQRPLPTPQPQVPVLQQTLSVLQQPVPYGNMHGPPDTRTAYVPVPQDVAFPHTDDWPPAPRISPQTTSCVVVPVPVPVPVPGRSSRSTSPNASLLEDLVADGTWTDANHSASDSSVDATLLPVPSLLDPTTSPPTVRPLPIKTTVKAIKMVPSMAEDPCEAPDSSDAKKQQRSSLSVLSVSTPGRQHVPDVNGDGGGEGALSILEKRLDRSLTLVPVPVPAASEPSSTVASEDASSNLAGELQTTDAPVIHSNKNRNSTPQYNFKSARGGRGGQVTELSSLWIDKLSKEQAPQTTSGRAHVRDLYAAMLQEAHPVQNGGKKKLVALIAKYDAPHC